MHTAASTPNVHPQGRATHLSGVAQTLLAVALPVWLALVPTHALAVDATGGNDTNVAPGRGHGRPSRLDDAAGPTESPSGTRRGTASPLAAPMRSTRAGWRPISCFTLSLAAGADPIDSGRERTLEFVNQPVGGAVVSDSRIKEITSTWFFRLVQPGVYFIRWRATKFAAGTANMTVDDSSLSVVCY